MNPGESTNFSAGTNEGGVALFHSLIHELCVEFEWLHRLNQELLAQNQLPERIIHVPNSNVQDAPSECVLSATTANGPRRCYFRCAANFAKFESDHSWY